MHSFGQDRREFIRSVALGSAGLALGATEAHGLALRPDVGSIAVLADVHLGCIKTDTIGELWGLLDEWSGDSTVHVVIGGDFIDPWCAGDNDLEKDLKQVSHLVEALSVDGRLSYVVGNHDYCIRRMALGLEPTDWAKKMGLNELNTYHRYLVLGFGGRRWVMCHGDEMNFGYSTRSFLRSLSPPLPGRDPRLEKHWPNVLGWAYEVIDRRKPMTNATVRDIHRRLVSLRTEIVGLRWPLRTAKKRKQGWDSDDVPSWEELLADSAISEDDIAVALSEAGEECLQELESGDMPQAEPGGPLGVPTPEGADEMSWTAEKGDLFDFSLKAARDRATPGSARDRPPNTVSQGDLRKSSLVIGHRHEPELIHQEDGNRDTYLIDAGSWHCDCDDVTYLWIDQEGPVVKRLVRAGWEDWLK